MAYERIESRSKRRVVPFVAITTNRKLRLNAAATKFLTEAGAIRVALFWDKQKRKLAIQVVAKDDPDSFKLTYSKTQRQADVGAKSFLVVSGLVPEDGRLDIPLQWNDTEKMLEGRVPPS